MKKTLFALAKSPLGEFIVGIGFGRFSSLLPVERVKETKTVLAFYHPKPSWGSHILVVPKKAIKSLDQLDEQDFGYVSDAFLVMQEIIREKAWSETDYSIITNGGHRQEVPQLHFHLVSGKSVDTQ